MTVYIYPNNLKEKCKTCGDVHAFLTCDCNGKTYKTLATFKPTPDYACVGLEISNSLRFKEIELCDEIVKVKEGEYEKN